ncbi:MBL fold metallo-hydrolase [Xanthobacter tagetidis]|uniref:MBL fold metallo-hydrolase n=1 Tax=Xanthobacter tagetidis TaxID=60216 RepID=A0A3L7A323_9HYPH|nr:MBL fold metallo-hydrolase [Xanthobacter tagetidis]MBB6307714.1 glyoxylase-like metal-dependent hydrolase (beta-lactamase superfamily II) [Xanthobacter tagetidis]RLP74425.1 MBL fold metallo-hydrolase [Xanthobacter tagetidis]
MNGAPPIVPGSTLRVLEPAPGVLAFYDGRIPGVRLHGSQENWLDDGAFALGIASYAVIHGDDALVYDTHITLAHARIVRRTLEEKGARRIRVVLSHWHDDHVAGNEAFADCEIIANRATDALLRANRARLEGGDPPIKPLVLPNRLFEDRLSLTVGTLPVELIQMDIHSRDGTVALLPDGLLLAGDTLEDPVTYVDEPERLDAHLAGLKRLAALGAGRILPNHGAPDVIASGGYPPALIDATVLYVERLLRLRRAPELAALDLRAFAAAAFATGAIRHFPPYEAVHQRNVAAVLAAG